MTSKFKITIASTNQALPQESVLQLQLEDFRKAAAFEGGGIIDAPVSAYESQFGPRPHTGIVYTPPRLSDHVAVSLYLDDENPVLGGRAYMESCKLRFDTCKETRLAQPHKKQPSIKSFFSNSTSTKMKKRKSTGTFDTQEKRKIPKQRTGLLKYFA
eukprot:CAMPEP_0184058754 /NCGR_PEP_ID=MMETSP0956-20121227/9493_1 /TAXON_ID=627963 /ORGANISM="Aplanochytrium sp, Strain PBS07" /LENGTH=156 /DNA_ID=CAMNT_0026353895 /DNA_START=148 /DNA_END=618 /DNA_ORIENTATION=+